MTVAVVAGNRGFGKVPDAEPPNELQYEPRFVQAPFIHWSKAEIAYHAIALGVPLHRTWSCYNGGENHCGRCGTCVERLEAIDTALTRWNVIEDHEHKVSDKTEYDDSTYWRTAVSGHASLNVQSI
jgi:hypothetical protein